jgi:hypothetical protein
MIPLADAYQQMDQRRREDIMEIGSNDLGRHENEIADVSLSGADHKISKHPRPNLGGLRCQHAEKICELDDQIAVEKRKLQVKTALRVSLDLSKSWVHASITEEPRLVFAQCVHIAINNPRQNCELVRFKCRI